MDAYRTVVSAKASDCGVTSKNNRLFIEALLWICRTGAPWRDLPSVFGRWHTVYMRYNRWSKKGRWQATLEALGAEPDLKYLTIKGLEVVANHWIIPPLIELQQRGKLQSKHRNTTHQVVGEGYFAPADGIWDAIKTPSHR